ncbi:TraR/DksA family transcriptional regulator [Cryobacterium lyxosi]|uniref:Molecular chaperone DnaK n=1 Tax=Cryobacterium lyxosi TaxID=1259228 RepID=A0A4R8Z8K4_9MICO|nr:TraR/DksA C4-type zinc finger protein [Cryobacterium lyxosi]TFD23115.1 molecular chaperone DnaK [Cryobacterium lyxosi]
MARTSLSDAELRRFDQALRDQRALTVTELNRLAESLTSVREARSDGSADDEHDPEGPTLSGEWSRIVGVHGEFNEKVAAIDRSLARIADGSYGTCIRCGKPIGAARLSALLTAELCIDCARLIEGRGR